MHKVHIIGAAGSGKTTLAQDLGARLHVPWFELDTVAYAGGYGRKQTLEARWTALHAIIAQPAWITEGAYLHWLDELLDAAQVIVWLDLPWYVSLPRIVTRHVRLSLAGKNRHPGVIKLLHFAWHCRTYYTDSAIHQPVALDSDRGLNRATTAHYLARWTQKIVHCRTAQDVKAFVASY